MKRPNILISNQVDNNDIQGEPNNFSRRLQGYYRIRLPGTLLSAPADYRVQADYKDN